VGLVRRIGTIVVAIAVIGAMVQVVVAPVAAFAAPIGLLEVDATRPGHAELAWTAVDGATSYTVERDGTPLLTANTLRYDDTSVAFGATYDYDVTATVSGSPVEVGSRSVSIPASADSGTPTPVTNLAVTSKTDGTVGLSWKGSTDDVKVIAYLVFSGGIRMAFTEGTKTVTVKNLRAATGYTFAVRALDAAGNLSNPTSISVTTDPSSDVTPPTAPSGVKATAFSSTEIDLTWGGVTDNHSLAGYLIFRNDSVDPIANIPVALPRFFQDTNVVVGTTYGYRVQAYDSAGNQSFKSALQSTAPLAPGVVKVVRGPLAQQVDRTSAQITWRTNIPAPSELSYTAGGVTRQVTDPVARTQHAVLIGGLPANATVTYAITYSGVTKNGSIRTCGQTSDPSNLSLVGDFGGGGPPEKDIASLIAGDHSDAIISTGDNVYPTGGDIDYVSRFFTPYANAFAGAPFWTAFGNHEYYDPGAAATHLNLTQPSNESWFSFDCSSVHMLVLDTEIPFGVGSPQYDFARSDLASATEPWKIVVLHRPPYSSSKSATEVRETYQPVFEQFGVHLVFSGHSHNYERSVPINGVTYIVTGGGGNGLNAFSGTPPSFSAFRAAEYHYIQAAVTPTTVAMTVRRRDDTILDQAAVTRTGDLSAPDAPTNLHATGADASSISIEWNAPADDVGVAGYRIFRDGSFIAQVGAQTTYTDTGLAPDTEYHYEVNAFDAAGNTSAASAPTPASTTVTGPDVTPPTVPGNLRAVSTRPGDVEIAWDASTDNVAVAGYDVFRDDVLYGSTGAEQLSFIDTAPAAGEHHDYQVRAVDTSNVPSARTAVLPISVASSPTLFTDTFESGSLSSWTAVNGITAVQGFPAPNGGQWVARAAASGGGSTWAYRSISPSTTELYARFRFKVVSRSGGVDLMRFRNGAGGSKLSLLVDGATGKLSTRNSAGITTKSNAVIANGVWNTVEVHGKIGAPSVTEVWLNGVLLPELSATGDLGTTNFGQVLLGHTTATGTYEVVFDDVIASKTFI
jgi:chitodextrinase